LKKNVDGHKEPKTKKKGVTPILENGRVGTSPDPGPPVEEKKHNKNKKNKNWLSNTPMGQRPGEFTIYYLLFTIYYLLFTIYLTR
jgi:hypothetical protein